ncbi:MAG: hypothetical protein JXJ17_09235 [Anaerolineae bacterium]|nr:hypothetical protein [Anaerolineae bacterium]
MDKYATRKNVYLIVVLVVLLGTILACGGTTVTPEPPTQVPPTEAPPGKTTEETGPSQGGKEGTGKGSMGEGATVPSAGDDSKVSTVNLTMVNDLGTEVCYVVISPNTSDEWGDDWLGGSETVVPGGRRVFELAPGVWDMAAVDCDLNYLAEEYGVYINSDTTWALSTSATAGSASTGNSTLTVLNNSSIDVCYVYLSPSTADSWGADWLGDDIIPAGTSYTFYVDAGTWDMRTFDCSMNVLAERYGESISGDFEWELYDDAGSTTEGTSTLTIINNSGMDICYVNISPSTASDWGADWLGSDIIPSGTSYTFWLYPDTWDMRTFDCSYTLIAERYSETISGDMEWELYETGGSSGGGSFEMEVINNLPEDICYVYFRSSGSSSWGADWLGNDMLLSGTSYYFYLSPGTYDMLAEDCFGVDSTVYYGALVDGDMYWEINVWDDTSDPDSATHPNGFTSSMEVINNLPEDICYVYFRSSGSSDWGPDWLGSDIIWEGTSYFFYMDAGTYDMRAEDCYGVDSTVYHGAYINGEMYWEINSWD